MSKARVSVFVVVAVMIVASMASPAWAELLKGADWQMNETSGQMIDSSANNNDGTPKDVVRTGSAYGFNGSTSYVAVPDSDSLNPEESDITLSAGVKVTDKPMDDDSYDIVRKGLVTTPGGDYKMEIKRGGRLHRRQAALPLQGRRWDGGHRGAAGHRGRRVAYAGVHKDEDLGGG